MNRRALIGVLLLTSIGAACQADQTPTEPPAVPQSESGSVWVDATVVNVVLTKVFLDHGRVVSRVPETTIAKSVVVGPAHLRVGVKAAMLSVPESLHTLRAGTIDVFPDSGPAIPGGQFHAEDQGSLTSGTVVELDLPHVAIQHAGGIVRARLASDTVISTLLDANLGEFLTGDSISALVDGVALRFIVLRPDDA